MSYEIVRNGITYYPVTSALKNVLMGEKVGSSYSNLCMLFHLESEVDAGIMESAINTALERMPTVNIRRHYFKDKKNAKNVETMQYFSDEPIKLVKLMSFSDEKKMYKYLDKLSKKPFENKACDVPLYDVILITKPDGKYAIYCKMNHFIVDSYGFMMFGKEVIEIYDAMLCGKELPKPLAPVLPAYEEQWNYSGSKKEKKDNEYWDKFWETHPEPQFVSINSPKTDKLCIPGQRVGNQFNIFHIKSKHLSLIFKKELIDRVNKYAMETGVSPQALFLIALRCYLYSLCENEPEAILINGTAAHRSKMAAKSTGGVLAGSCLLYMDVKGVYTFSEACQYTASQNMEYYKHARADVSAQDRNLVSKITSIFEKGWIKGYCANIFTYQPYFINANTETDIKFRIERIPGGISPMPVYLIIMPMDNYTGDMHANYEYVPYSVSEASIIACHEYMVKFLERALDNPEKTLNELM